MFIVNKQKSQQTKGGKDVDVKQEKKVGRILSGYLKKMQCFFYC